MRAQNELSPYFAEIDRRTDLALEGIRQVRKSAKFKTLPQEPKAPTVGTAFVFALVAFVGLFLD